MYFRTYGGMILYLSTFTLVWQSTDQIIMNSLYLLQRYEQTVAHRRFAITPPRDSTTRYGALCVSNAHIG